MNVCPNCKHTNMAGAVFCSECGFPLDAEDMLTTQTIATGQVKEALGRQKGTAGPPPPVLPDSWMTLHLLDSGQLLPLSDRREFTLGRISEGQPIMPDIDLSPYQAYASGVSRLHAVIKQQGQRVIIMDLGSSNGTYLNGKRLTPNVEHILHHGDVVALGKLKIQVLLKTT